MQVTVTGRRPLQAHEQPCAFNALVTNSRQSWRSNLLCFCYSEDKNVLPMIRSEIKSFCVHTERFPRRLFNLSHSADHLEILITVPGKVFTEWNLRTVVGVNTSLILCSHEDKASPPRFLAFSVCWHRSIDWGRHLPCFEHLDSPICCYKADLPARLIGIRTDCRGHWPPARKSSGFGIELCLTIGCCAWSDSNMN